MDVAPAVSVCGFGGLGCCCNMLLRAWPKAAADTVPASVSVTESDPAPPLTVDEVLGVLRSRWRASYDMQVVQRRGRLYLQVMWAYLEQQSFPLDAEGYGLRMQALVDLLNELGVAQQVRQWLGSTTEKPRLGKAMGLPLETGGRGSEFLL